MMARPICASATAGPVAACRPATLNITAEYRAGIGFDGEVPEAAVSQLKTRPLGIRGVVNPSPATGAADRELLESARRNAPGTIKTLGRIVSLTDYEDFASAFAGIGKAQARELWSGQQKVVHLTIAPEADAELTASDPLIVNLANAIARVRDPARPLVLQAYERRYFTIAARIEADPAYLPEDVATWARQSIQRLFGYQARSLTQPVSAAEVIAALQATTGVVAVDLDLLAILLDGSTAATTGIDLAAVLPALPALGPGQRGQRNAFTAAQLLTVLPSAITLTIMETVDA
jgi:predicted phage baseplate assembly protein